LKFHQCFSSGKIFLAIPWKIPLSARPWKRSFRRPWPKACVVVNESRNGSKCQHGCFVYMYSPTTAFQYI